MPHRSVRRTIWDGNQELAEIQAPVDTTDTTVEEKDQASGANGWGLRPCQSIGGKCFADPNPYFGRVVYGPALRTDQPISVTRFDYQDEQRSASPPISGTWPTFTMVPYWNYQGAPSFSTFGTATNGAGLAWLPLSKGASQTVCPPLADTTAQRCVRFQWPFARSAYDQNRGKAARFSWLGSLLENKRDGSGLEYKRSRQYDPLSGRFTQEDPIGLAGGLNLYGFASGDPVNFSDPFGLDTLRYNGRTLTLIGDDGKTRWSGRAYSGRPGTTASEQFVSDRGPIPEGEYSLDPSKISHVTGVRAWIRNRLGDWGEYRVGLTPEAGTDTRGRDGLMLHGGKKPGSAGCIDVCGLEGTLFPLLMSHNGTIRVIVGYPSGSTVPTPPQ